VDATDTCEVAPPPAKAELLCLPSGGLATVSTSSDDEPECGRSEQEKCDASDGQVHRVLNARIGITVVLDVVRAQEKHARHYHRSDCPNYREDKRRGRQE